MHNGKPQVYGASETLTQSKAFDRLISGSVLDVTIINQITRLHALEKVISCKRIYVIMDGSESRKPYAKKMEKLMKVTALNGHIVNGYRTSNAVLMDENMEEIALYDSIPFSSEENICTCTSQDHVDTIRYNYIGTGDDMFIGETDVIERHIEDICRDIRRVNPIAEIVFVLDREYDATSIIETVIEQKANFTLRASHTNRKVVCDDKEMCLKELPVVVMEEKKLQKVRIKSTVYQDVTLRLSSISYLVGEQKLFIIKVEVINRHGQNIFAKDPMWLITNEEVSLENIYGKFKEYLARWKIENVFKFLKDVLGWEEYQTRNLQGIKNLIVLTFMVGAYLYEIGSMHIEESFVVRLCELGRGKGKVGRKYAIQGLRRLMDMQISLDTLLHHADDLDKILEDTSIDPKKLKKTLLSLASKL